MSLYLSEEHPAYALGYMTLKHNIRMRMVKTAVSRVGRDEVSHHVHEVREVSCPVFID